MDRQRRPVTPTIARIRFRCSTVWGLRGISFAIEPGSAVALLGRNGSGKTTLLRTLAGVLVPDEGHVEVQGRVASLLSTQAGSMSDLTGRENALLLGVLAGLPRARVQAAFETIRDRSGLGDAFERLVGTYSQGMRARFGFAVIEEVEPEVLLLDEVFEALDGSFRRHVEARARKICDRGGIVIAAGHDYAELGRICDQALVLDEPGVRHISDFDESFTASFAPAVTDRVSE
jgi:ABC-type polysaccharide/polyol phosphate transport system ATPase subunit